MLPKFLVACDTFKGSVASPQACAAIQRGLERAFHATASASACPATGQPALQVVTCPISDGGAGLLDALCHAVPTLQRRRVQKRIIGPLGDTLDGADFAINEATGAVVVEMAQATGLPLVPVDQRDPLLTTSYGTGQLILEAVADAERTNAAPTGHKGTPSSGRPGWRLYLGVGGSSTNDGGLGALQAMGLDVHLDGSPTPLQRPVVGRDLSHVSRLVPSPAFQALRETMRGRLVLICDVDNPFTGPHGATRVYGPQKGAASEAMLSELEDGMCHLADLIVDNDNKLAATVDLRTLAGAGAGGGMGGTMSVLLNAECRCGADVVAEIVDLPRLVDDADIVITGEGCFDLQTLRHQKTVSKLAQLVVRSNRRTRAVQDGQRPPRQVVVVCGRTDVAVNGSAPVACVPTDGDDPEAITDDIKEVMAVVSHIVPLSPVAFSADEAMQRGAACMEAVVANDAPSWLTGAWQRGDSASHPSK